ncbi:MAG: DUF3303 family protein [Candidatus Bathyarchaeota archaeon]
MPTFLVIQRHSPENCPRHNEKTRKIRLEFMDKAEAIMKKHGVKMVGGWVVHAEHLTVAVFEAPSLEAFQKCAMEPEHEKMSAYNTMEVKLAMSIEEATKILKQTK